MKPPFRSRYFSKHNKPLDTSIRINEKIRVPEVRLIDNQGEQKGIISIQEALELAKSKDLDLVEVSSTSNPPVCKILDFSKFQFKKKKQIKENLKKQKQVQLKEIKIRPNINEHDLEFKQKHIEDFLEKGNKVKVTVQFKGREITHVENGKKILIQLKKTLSDKVQIEKDISMEGWQMTLLLNTIKSKP